MKSVPWQRRSTCWLYVFESSDSVAVFYIVTSDVVGDDVYQHRSVVFPTNEIADLSTIPRAPQAAMGLWRPQTGPGDPGPVPTSSCNSCMKCQYCFPGVGSLRSDPE